MTAKKMRRKVAKRVEIAPDLELHVSHLTVAGQRLVEIRNFIPSTKEYGRGVTAPIRHCNGIVEGVIDVRQEDLDERRDEVRTERSKRPRQAP